RSPVIRILQREIAQLRTLIEVGYPGAGHTQGRLYQAVSDRSRLNAGDERLHLPKNGMLRPSGSHAPQPRYAGRFPLGIGFEPTRMLLAFAQRLDRPFADAFQVFIHTGGIISAQAVRPS